MQQLKSLVERVGQREAEAPPDPRGWNAMLAEIESAVAQILSACGDPHSSSAAVPQTLPPPALPNRAAALAKQVEQLRSEFDTLFPWVAHWTNPRASAIRSFRGRPCCKPSSAGSRPPILPR